MSDYPAHIRSAGTVRQVQTVEEHCKNVARCAAASLQSVGMYGIGYLAGMVHDCGKFTDAFAEYINKAANNEPVLRGSVNHTFAGVIFLFEKYHDGRTPSEMLTAEILAYAVGAHHGLFDCVDFKGNSGFVHRIQKDKQEISYEIAIENYYRFCASEKETDSMFARACAETDAILKKLKNKYKEKGAFFVLGLAVRMVLSALIDADWRDTAAFMSGDAAGMKTEDSFPWQRLLQNVENKLAEFPNDTPINCARSEFSRQCCAFAEKYGAGIYRLTLPTGGSKTLSSLRYALTNAQTFHKKRIIFVIPLLSVLEQNCAVIKKFIGDESVILEHHSNVILNDENVEEGSFYRVLTQTWDAPIVITTMVQLLNTLFGGKNTDLRRMRALCDSVIIIDEIQSLPKKTIEMFQMAMGYLAHFCNATAVLCSATQPDFRKCNYPMELSEPHDIVPYSERLFSVFKRTQAVDKTTPSGMSMEQFVAFVRGTADSVNSLLVICNTKDSAVKLYAGLKQTGGEDCALFHLSTAMCMQHRMDTLNRIMSHLERQRDGAETKKIICVATQLVEAGVDFSFQSVIRVRAGMDNIAQAAGRCNRSGEFHALCPVYLVNLNAEAEHLTKLKEIKVAADVTASLLYTYQHNPDAFKNDLLSEESIAWFYGQLFSRREIRSDFEYSQNFPGGVRQQLFDLLALNGDLRKRVNFKDCFILGQSFKTAGDAFQVFDENTVDVLVPYDETAQQLIADLCSERAAYDYAYVKHLLSSAQLYTVKLFQYKYEKLKEEGMVYLCAHDNIAVLQDICYSADTGVREPDLICF